MRSWPLLLIALVPLLHGCVTPWMVQELVNPSVPSPPDVATIVSAVRTGDGAHHLLLRCGDRRTRHVVFPTTGTAPVDSEVWPHVDEHRAYVVEPGTPFPDGSPVSGERWSWAQLPA